MTRSNPIRPFLSAFIPIAVWFLTERLVQQVSLFLISGYGETAIAAFGIPFRLMVIENLLTFGLAPVASVMIARAGSAHTRSRAVTHLLAFSLAVSLLATVVAFVLYSPLAAWIAPEARTLLLTRRAVFWLTLGIPIRLTYFTATLAIHGIGKGRFLIPVNLFEVLLQAGVGSLFSARLGFEGVYLSMLICWCAGLVIQFAILRHSIRLRFLIPALFLRSARWIGSKLLMESSRMIWLRLTDLLLLYLFSSGAGSLPNPARLSAFSVASELSLLVFMPTVAVMRATSIVASRQRAGTILDVYRDFLPIFRLGLIALVPVCLSLPLCSSYLGETVFHLSGPAMIWWRPLVCVAFLSLPIKLADAIQRGIWQSRQRFLAISLTGALGRTLFCIPFVFLGVRNEWPWVAAFGLLAADAFGSLLLAALAIRERSRARLTPAALPSGAARSTPASIAPPSARSTRTVPTTSRTRIWTQSAVATSA